MYDQLFPDNTEQAFQARLMRPEQPDRPRFNFWKTVAAGAKGLPAGAAEGLASTSDVASGFGQVMAATDARPGGMFSLNKPRTLNDLVLGSTEQDRASRRLLTQGVDFQSEAGRSFRNVARDYMPDPLTTHASEQVVANMTRVAGKAVTAAVTLGNVPGAVVAGTEEAFTQSDALAQAGVDPSTRMKVGAVNAAINSLSFALPIAGKTWAQTTGLALTGGPVAFIGQNAATRKILEDADYSQIADQYDPLDPVGLTLSTMIPFAFGALAMRGRSAVKKAPAPEAVDAARVALLRENVDGSNPLPGLDTADAHARAYTQAMEQMAAGERVDVAAGLPEAMMARAGDGMAIRVRAADPIDSAPNLTEAQRQLETDLADFVLNDSRRAVEAYNLREDSMGGKVLNTDIARELSAGYLADRTQSAAVHEPASYFVKQLYAEKLKNVQEGDTVLFTSGGTGAGKTTGIRDVPMAQAIADRSAMIYDTNMNSLDSAVKKIEQALEAKGKVQLIHVQRDPVDALVNGALKRAMGQEQKYGTGRTVPLSEHAKTHRGAAEVLPQLVERYKDDPRVGFLVIDNTHGKGKAKLADVEFVKKFDYNDLEGKLNEALKRQYDSGAISESVYRGTSEDVGKGRSTVPGPDVPPQPELQHPAGKPGSGAQEGAPAAGDYLTRETQRLIQESPETPILLEGMDKPMPLSEVMAQIKQDLQADLADVPLLKTAAECFMQSIGAAA